MVYNMLAIYFKHVFHVNMAVFSWFLSYVSSISPFLRLACISDLLYYITQALNVLIRHWQCTRCT